MIAKTAKPEAMTKKASRKNEAIAPKQLMLAFAALFLLNLLLRVFYLRYDFVNGDEAVRALTAARLLEGAQLYIDVITDKPPGATLFYAAVFKLFGRSMVAVHLAAAIWNFATALVVYATAAKFYSKRAGLWAALLFIYFSTNYHTQDMMAANTELLMALPYTASFFFFVSAGRAKERRSEVLALVSAGLMTGIAIIFKQVGVFNLLFFVACEAAAIFSARLSDRANLRDSLYGAARRSVARLSLIALGFAVVLALKIAWLYSTGSLAGFWRNAVALGGLYIGSLPTELWIKFMIARTFGYALFNAALWSLAILAAARAISRYWKQNREGIDFAQTRFEAALVLWGAVSFSGIFTGGRFYGHYFIQALPALSLLAARGVEILGERLNDSKRRRSALAAAYALVALFLFSFIRFHHRTAILAYETLTGARTRWSESWGMDKREREAEQVARIVRDQVGEGEPLYIWGYALDVYWRSGCRPASRYLTPYYVTGHFYPEVTSGGDGPQAQFWAEARAQLIEDLKRTRPRLILNIDEAIWSLPYPEVVDFIRKNYRYEGQIGSDPSRPFLVFRRKNKAEK